MMTRTWTTTKTSTTMRSSDDGGLEEFEDFEEDEER